MNTCKGELHRNRFKTKSKSLSTLMNRTLISSMFNENPKERSYKIHSDTQREEWKSPTILSPTFNTPTLSPTLNGSPRKKRKNIRSIGLTDGDNLTIKFDTIEKKKLIAIAKANHERVHWLAQTNYTMNHVNIEIDLRKKMVECPYDIHSNKIILEIVMTYREYAKLLMEQVISMICYESSSTLDQIEWYKREMHFLLECYEVWRKLIPELERPVLTTEYQLENYQDIIRAILRVNDPLQLVRT